MIKTVRQLKTKNHYVPEMYLNQWADQSNKVCVYKTLVPHHKARIWKKHFSGAIGYQKHLYTQLVSGEESDDFERWLDSHYESPANEVIEKVVENKKLSSSDWGILIRFLACQDVRTPARLLEHIKRGETENLKILRECLEEIKQDLENGKTDHDDKIMSLDTKKEKYPIKVEAEHLPNSDMGVLRVKSYTGRASWISSIKILLGHAERILHQHKWTIIKPCEGYSWPTSDNPVIKLNYVNDTRYDFGGGWGRNKGNIIFPIGPQHAMFVQIGDRPMPKGARLNESMTRQLRKFIAQHAHRIIFSDHFDEEVALLRPRVVDERAVITERKQLDGWHEHNKKLESEYLG